MRVTFVLIRTTRSFLPPQTNNKLKINKQFNTNDLHSYTFLRKKKKEKNNDLNYYYSQIHVHILVNVYTSARLALGTAQFGSGYSTL